jgi:hypothetical protein
MTRKKKTIIGVGILIVGILFWQFGFFNRFNYLTAKIDIIRDSPRIATIGKILPCGVPCISLNEKYGFHEANLGCSVNDPLLRGINAYNSEIEKYLNKRNGKNWRKKYETELESLIDTNMLE